MDTISPFRFILLLGGAMAFAGPALAQIGDIVRTKEVSVRVEKLAEGLEHPWAVEVLPDGSYIVTERPGRLRIIRDGRVSDPIRSVPELMHRDPKAGRLLHLTHNLRTERDFLLVIARPARE